MKIGFRVPYDYVVPEFAHMYFEYFQFLECKVKGKSSSASVLEACYFLKIQRFLKKIIST